MLPGSSRLFTRGLLLSAIVKTSSLKYVGIKFIGLVYSINKTNKPTTSPNQ